MFEAKINESEVAVLLHLHSGVNGYGPRFTIQSSKIADAIGLSREQLVKALSYLAQHGLVCTPEEDVRPELTGDRSLDGRRAMVVLKRAYDDVWLTGLGENFCRILDEAPGATKSIASNVGNAVGAEILTTARTVLTELTKIAVATAMGR